MVHACRRTATLGRRERKCIAPKALARPRRGSMSSDVYRLALSSLSGKHEPCNYVRKLLKRFDSIDCVCVNAGVPERGDFLLRDSVDIDRGLVEPVFKLIGVYVNGVMRSKSLLLQLCIFRGSKL